MDILSSIYDIFTGVQKCFTSYEELQVEKEKTTQSEIALKASKELTKKMKDVEADYKAKRISFEEYDTELSRLAKIAGI